MSPGGSLRRRLLDALKPALSRATDHVEIRRLRARQDHDDVAVFAVPAIAGGGVISIHDLADVSRRIGRGLGFDVHLARMPNALVRRTAPSPNGTPAPMPSLTAVLDAYAPTARRIWLHTPELRTPAVLESLWPRLGALAAGGAVVTANILNQNVDLMPGPEALDALRVRAERAGVRLTCTTAHQAYSTDALRAELGFPLHHVSTWLTPEDYEFARYRPERAHRVVLSPDRSPQRAEAVRTLTAAEGRPEIRVVRNMAYSDYLDLVWSSRWSMTLGEGLDGYFIEMGLSGGVPFAVYNDRFFTPDFLELPNVFATWDAFFANWPELFRSLHEDPAHYRSVADATRERLALVYDRRRHVDNLARYYAGRYDRP